eukprot:tig00020960_g16597.t1
MKALGRALKRTLTGKVPMKYSFNIVLSFAQNFPSRIQGTMVQTELKRGTKTRASGPASIQQRNGKEIAVWEETLSVTVTMFKDQRTHQFTEKEAKISVLAVEGPAKQRVLGSTYLNLAEFVLPGTQEFRETLVLPLSNSASKRQRKFSRGAQSAPHDAVLLTATIQTWWLQDYKRRDDASSHLSDRTGVTATTAGALGADTDFDDSDVEDAAPEPDQYRRQNGQPAGPPAPAWQQPPPQPQAPLAQPLMGSNRPSMEGSSRSRGLFGVDPGPGPAQTQAPPQFRPPPPAGPPPPAPHLQQHPQSAAAPYRPPPPAGPPPPQPQPIPQPIQSSYRPPPQHVMGGHAAPPAPAPIQQSYQPPAQPYQPPGPPYQPSAQPYQPPGPPAPQFHQPPGPPPAASYMPEPVPTPQSSFRGRDPAPVFRPIGAPAGAPRRPARGPMGAGPGAPFLGAGPPLTPAGSGGRVRSAYAADAPVGSGHRGTFQLQAEQPAAPLQQPSRPSLDRSAAGPASGRPSLDRPLLRAGAGAFPGGAAGPGPALGPTSLAPAFSHAQAQVAGRAAQWEAGPQQRSLAPAGPAPPLRRPEGPGSDGPSPAETPRSVAAYGPGPGISPAALTRALTAAQQAEAGQREAELRRLHDLEGRVKTLYLANVELQRERQQLQEEKAAIAAQLKAAEERAAWLHADRERLNEQLNRGAAKDQHLRAAEEAVSRVERERDRMAGELRAARDTAGRQRATFEAELRAAVERAWADSTEQHRASAARLADENAALRRRVDELAVLASAPRSPMKAPAPANAGAGRVEFVCAKCKMDPMRRGTYTLSDGRSLDDVEDLIGAKLALAEAHTDLHELRNAMAKMKRRSNALEDEIRKAKLILETHVPGYKSSDEGLFSDLGKCLPLLSQPPADLFKS